MKASDKDVTRGEDRKRKEIVFVKLDEIVSDPDQPREYFYEERLKDLARTIKRVGLIHPIIVRRDEHGKIKLVAGGRRVRAAAMVGLEEVPALFTEDDPFEVAVIENLQREDLDYFEEAAALKRLKDKHKYTDNALSVLLGKGRSTITEILSINRISDNLKEECRRLDRMRPVKISKRALIRIAKMEGTDGDKLGELLLSIARPPRPTEDIAKDRATALNKILNKLKKHGIKQSKTEELETELNQLKRLIDDVLASLNQTAGAN